MKVETVMTRSVQSCRPSDTMNEAARIMWEADCGSVPVVDDLGCVVGMITDRDLCMAAYTRGLPVWAMAVSDAMAHDVATCRPGDTCTDAERVMRERQVRRLPVVDSAGRLTGMLSLSDLAARAERGAAAGRRELTAEEVAATLAAVSRPRRPQLAVATA